MDFFSGVDRQGVYDFFPAFSVSTVVLGCEITFDFVTIWIGIPISSSLSTFLLARLIFFVIALTLFFYHRRFFFFFKKKEEEEEEDQTEV